MSLKGDTTEEFTKYMARLIKWMGADCPWR